MKIFKKEKKTISCIRKEADENQIIECREIIANLNIKELSNILNLSSNEIRLKILYLINSQSELCPCDLSDILDMTIPAISQHLRKLKDAGVIDYRKQGNTNYYYILENNYQILNMIFDMVDENKELV